MLKPFDAKGHFVASVVAGGGAIRRLTVRGAGATVFAGAASLVIQLGSTVVLARLLMPADFGLVAMVTTFSLLLVNFGFNGLTEAIVQREELNHALVSTLFWISLGSGMVLTIAFAAAGSLLARLYHNPLVANVAVGISLTIVVTSISTVHLALLKRSMQFSMVSANDICARVVSVGLAIALGWMGWGYWALVAAAIAVPASTAVGALILCPWMPGPPRWVPGTGPTLRFALSTYGNFSVNYASRNTDNLLVGWRFDARSLGFYKKAYDLFALTASQLASSISVVVVAGLSRVKRDPAVYRRYLLDAMAVMAFVGMGLGAILTVTGKDLIWVLLGPKWGPAGQIFTFFGPGIGIMILYVTHGWIHLSVGRPDRWFRWGIIEFIVTCSLFVAGLHWGPIGIACAWSISFWVLTLPAIWYAGKPISLRAASVLAAVWKYLVASLFAVAGTALMVRTVPFLSEPAGVPLVLLRMALVSAFVATMYLGAVVLLHRGFTPLRQFAILLQEMVPSGNSHADRQSQTAPNMRPDDQVVVDEFDHLPLVSILIPAYNAEEWIEDTLRSALAQTWPRTEIIVVDDGSTDNTLAVARRFESQRVSVIMQKNQGASAARNNAFAHCHGDYIQWLDADDLLAPDKISLQMRLVQQGLSPRTLLSCGWGRFMYRPLQAQFIPSSLWRDLSPEEWLLRKMGQNVYMQTATWLVSREVTEAAGPWNIRLLGDDDGEYFCRVLLASNGVRFVPDAKVYYRAFRFDSLSYIGRFPEKIEAHWASMLLHIRYLRSLDDSAEARETCMQYVRDSLIYFYPESADIVAQATALATELGRPLGVPELSWKYSWIVSVFGWGAVKTAQQMSKSFRWRISRGVDSTLFHLQGRKQVYPRTAGTETGAGDVPLEPLAVEEPQAL